MTRPTNRRDVLTLLASRALTRGEVYEAMGCEVPRVQVGTLLRSLVVEGLITAKREANTRFGPGQHATVLRYRGRR